MAFRRSNRRTATRTTRRRSVSTARRRRAPARRPAARQQTVKVVIETAPSLGTSLAKRFTPRQTGPR